MASATARSSAPVARAAILHSTPGPTIVGPDDVVLIDAGGEVAGYTADVTRTFPAGERFTPEQQAIYDLVLAAELAAIAKCRDGVEWHDVHRTAAVGVGRRPAASSAS